MRLPALQIVLTPGHFHQVHVGPAQDPVKVTHLDIGFQHDLGFSRKAAVGGIGQGLHPGQLLFQPPQLFQPFRQPRKAHPVVFPPGIDPIPLLPGKRPPGGQLFLGPQQGIHIGLLSFPAQLPAQAFLASFQVPDRLGAFLPVLPGPGQSFLPPGNILAQRVRGGFCLPGAAPAQLLCFFAAADAKLFQLPVQSGKGPHAFLYRFRPVPQHGFPAGKRLPDRFRPGRGCILCRDPLFQLRKCIPQGFQRFPPPDGSLSKVTVQKLPADFRQGLLLLLGLSMKLCRLLAAPGSCFPGNV